MSAGDGIGVALDALRSDANKWNAASQDLSNTISSLDSLKVTVADVSVFAQWADLDQSLNDATSAISDALQKASNYFAKISSDLNESATEYQADDEKGMHEVRGAYRIEGDLYGG